MTTAAKVIEWVRLMVKAPAESRGAVPAPAALHVGERAHWLISDAAGWRSVHRGELLPALFGVPIVPTSDMGTEWRVLNGAGAVIAEGVVDP